MKVKMIVTPTCIPDVILIEPQVFTDFRGFFMETHLLENLKKTVTYQVRSR